MGVDCGAALFKSLVAGPTALAYKFMGVVGIHSPLRAGPQAGDAEHIILNLTKFSQHPQFFFVIGDCPAITTKSLALAT